MKKRRLPAGAGSPSCISSAESAASAPSILPDTRASPASALPSPSMSPFATPHSNAPEHSSSRSQSSPRSSFNVRSPSKKSNSKNFRNYAYMQISSAKGLNCANRSAPVGDESPSCISSSASAASASFILPQSTAEPASASPPSSWEPSC